jgi:hypothetical protein
VWLSWFGGEDWIDKRVKIDFCLQNGSYDGRSSEYENWSLKDKFSNLEEKPQSYILQTRRNEKTTLRFSGRESSHS